VNKNVSIAAAHRVVFPAGRRKLHAGRVRSPELAATPSINRSFFIPAVFTN
jgi:hypothetical protein